MLSLVFIFEINKFKVNKKFLNLDIVFAIHVLLLIYINEFN